MIYDFNIYYVLTFENSDVPSFNIKSNCHV
jgi:hypothetical protein